MPWGQPGRWPQPTAPSTCRRDTDRGAAAASGNCRSGLHCGLLWNKAQSLGNAGDTGQPLPGQLDLTVVQTHSYFIPILPTSCSCVHQQVLCLAGHMLLRSDTETPAEAACSTLWTRHSRLQLSGPDTWAACPSPGPQAPHHSLLPWGPAFLTVPGVCHSRPGWSTCQFPQRSRGGDGPRQTGPQNSPGENPTLHLQELGPGLGQGTVPTDTCNAQD